MAQHVGAVRGRHHDVEHQVALDHLRVRADGGDASGFEAAQQGTLSADGEAGFVVVCSEQSAAEGTNRACHLSVGEYGGVRVLELAFAHFQGERTLAGGGQHAGGVKVLGDEFFLAQALEAGDGEHHGVAVAAAFGAYAVVGAFGGFSVLAEHDLLAGVLFQALHAADAGAHVTADVHDFKVGAQCTQLGGAAG